MTNFMENVYKKSIWIITAASLIGFFSYQVVRFSGSIESVLSDPASYFNVVFSIFLNLVVQTGAVNKGTMDGLESENFKLADELNTQLVQQYNSNSKVFRPFVKQLNKELRKETQENYLEKIGDKELDELTKKELKKYNKLKPIVHNTYGFNLPLYYQVEKNGQINYNANSNEKKGIVSKRVKKVFTGALFGGMTVSIAFSVNNIGDALLSTLIIGAGLVITFLLSYAEPMHRFSKTIPAKVILKQTLFQSFEDFKNGKHELVKEIEVEKEVKEEVEIIESIH